MVLEVQDQSAAGERTRLDDHVELLVDEPRRALRHNLNPSLAKDVEQPVRTGRQESLELAIAEDQAHLVVTNLDVLEQRHGCTSFPINSATASNQMRGAELFVLIQRGRWKAGRSPITPR